MFTHTNVAFDARSLDRNRNSGWERFSRGLFSALQHLASPAFSLSTINNGNSPTPLGIIQDCLTLKQNLGVRHYPSLPPAHPDKKTLLTIHDATWWKHPEYSSRMGRLILKGMAESAVHKGAKIVTVSESAKLDLCEFLNLDQNDVRVVYPGLTDFRSNAEVGHPNQMKPYFLFVGTLEPRKNLPTLLKAFEETGLSETLDLVLIGRFGWKTEKPKGIRHLENLGDADLANWFKHAEALVMPSFYEGFGLPLLEAFSFGCPVIASDIPVFREVAGSKATYFDPRDSSDLAWHLLHGLDRKTDTSALLSRAKEFNWTKSAEEYLAIYKEMNYG